MFTATMLLPTLACLMVMPVAFWALGLLFRVLGWTLRLGFSILGVFLMPLWLVLMAFGGVAMALRFALPLALVWLVFSAFNTES